MSASVFVIGAGGYIGKGVALAFRRAGYRVYGLVRNEKYSNELIQNEIEPIVAQAFDDLESLTDVLSSCSIIIDAVGYNAKLSPNLLQTAVKIGKIRTDDGKLPHYAPLYIFTSGIMTCKLKEHVCFYWMVYGGFQMVIHRSQVVVRLMKWLNLELR